ECLDSILNQTYQNLEIILVNDGSTDSSGKICDDYAAKDGRIKVIHQENGGLSDARNKGLDAMTGQFVTFVDSDDYLGNHCIKTLYIHA
ncbi:glycosyltransferase family 2 protein, partial [Streptococcus suis]